MKIIEDETFGPFFIENTGKNYLLKSKKQHYNKNLKRMITKVKIVGHYPKLWGALDDLILNVMGSKKDTIILKEYVREIKAFRIWLKEYLEGI